ncbi:MAG: hypothetical protein Q7V31_11960 [Parvibaculum sp.]|uniref:hypothetical protein n=1 Tax=Parvibaculum sp. TaxID=2024848 RepID=UPI0027198391|nr:hypothetical protein [Parvibaculum sp.]MDO8839633.1 hypothetical protein [Parvibaculum sp.]
MANADNGLTTFNAVMRSRAFRAGYADRKAGLPPDRKWADAAAGDAQNYEDGRALAIVCDLPVDAFKPVRGRVSRAALDAMRKELTTDADAAARRARAILY